MADTLKPEITSDFSGVTKTLKDATTDINKQNLILPNIVRDYDARAVPFDQWEEQINNQYISIQKETAKRILKRYYKQIIVQDQETMVRYMSITYHI